MAKQTDSDDPATIAFRPSPELRARLQAEQERMSSSVRVHVSMSMVVSSLLTAALDQMDENEKGKRK